MNEYFSALFWVIVLALIIGGALAFFGYGIIVSIFG